MLQTIIGYVTTAILSYIVGWVSKIIHSWLQDQKTEKDAKDSVDPLKKAQTGEEIDAAIDKSLDGF